MPNDVFEAARTIMAVREFQDKEVPEEAIRRIVEAAHLTASAANRQPWHFVLVRKREALRKLGSLVRTGPYTANAAAAVIVAYEKGSKSGVSDASRAIQSMMPSPQATSIIDWMARLASETADLLPFS